MLPHEKDMTTDYYGHDHG